MEVREADLAFGHAEANSLVASITGSEPEPAWMELLLARTGGWAVGLSLAAHSMRSMDDPSEFLRGFDGTDRLVAEYLTCEVLDRLKPDLRSFVLRSSVLPWLSAELCAALDDTPDPAAAAEAIDHLRRRSMFVTPLEGPGQRLRYHQLFAELLRYQLDVESPRSVEDLRRRASRWLEANGHTSEAADQLVALDDHESLLSFVRRHGHEYFARDESATVLAWLDSVARPDRPIGLLIDRMAAEMATHETTRARETYRQLKRRPDYTSGPAAAAQALYACVGLDDLPADEIEKASTGAARDLERAVVEGSEVTDFLGIGGRDTAEAMADYMAAMAELHRGRVHAAADRLEAVLALPGMEYSLWKISALSALALARSLAGRHTHALADARAAIDLASTVSSEHHHAITHAHMALALTGWDRLHPELAADHLEDARICAERSGWKVDRALHRMLAARIDWAVHGPAEGLRDPLFSLPPANLPPLVVCESVACRERMAALAGAPDTRGELLNLVPECDWLRSIEIDVALWSSDLRTAASLLERWEPDPHDLRQRVGRLLRSAVLHDLGSRHDLALAEAGEALAEAEPEEIRAVFAEVPGAPALVRSDERLARQPFARSVLGSIATMVRQVDRVDLFEPLTERERELLPYLPTRLTNAEIAEELYISLNTVKSHLRHIYWKLSVDNRDAAVQRATELGLL